MAATGKTPADLELDSVRFWDWLVRDGDRAVFDFPPKAQAPSTKNP
jgi:hypothetical protein